jgi:hypothetical protein
VSAFHAARVAAVLRKTLGIEVDEIAGRYGEFTVLVDGEAVMSGGPLAILGVLPSADAVREVVQRRLGTGSAVAGG